MLTVAHKVVNGGKGEDRLLVERRGPRTLAVVADGAGGIGGGKIAAELTCSMARDFFQTDTVRTPDYWVRCLLDIDCALAGSAAGGQSTAVVAEIANGQVAGASVGDSGAWILGGREIHDLTETQHRKPLLGSGDAFPVGFGPAALAAFGVYGSQPTNYIYFRENF